VRGGEEGPYHLTVGVGIELAGMEPDVVTVLVRPNGAVVVLQRGDALGDELHSHHRSGEAFMA
jgi:hypothetical protein